MLDVNLASSDYEMILRYANLHSDDRKEIRKVAGKPEIKYPVF